MRVYLRKKILANYNYDFAFTGSLLAMSQPSNNSCLDGCLPDHYSNYYCFDLEKASVQMLFGSDYSYLLLKEIYLNFDVKLFS